MRLLLMFIQYLSYVFYLKKSLITNRIYDELSKLYLSMAFQVNSWRSKMVFVPGLAYHLFSKSNNEKFHHLNFNGQLNQMISRIKDISP